MKLHYEVQKCILSHQSEKLLFCKNLVKRMKGQNTDGKKYLQNHKCSKLVGLVSIIYKELSKLNSKNNKQPNLIKKKGRGTRSQIANICWIIEKAREFQESTYFCFIEYTKAFDSVDLNKLWKILQEMEIPEHLSCLLRNLYVGQEATVRTRHGTTDWFQIGKWVCQGCILWPCLFKLYAEWKGKLLSCVPTICNPMDYVYSPWNSPG